MTFRSPRNLLFVVPVFVAAGIVAACGNDPGPGCKPPPGGTCPPGISLPFPPNPPYSLVAPHTAMQPYPPPSAHPTPLSPPSLPTPPGWTLTASGNGKISIQTMDGLSAVSAELTLPLNNGKSVAVSQIEKKIRILIGKSSTELKGEVVDYVEGEADKVLRSASDGAVFTLEGNAKLISTRGGKTTQSEADRITVNVLTRKIESEFFPCPSPSGIPAPAPPGKLYPETPVRYSPSPKP